MSSSWFFKINTEDVSSSEGLAGMNPFPSSTSLFKTVLRKFTGVKTEDPTEYQSDGAQSNGLVNVEGAVNSVRCGAITFGAQAEEVTNHNTTGDIDNNSNNKTDSASSSSSSSSTEKEVTFNISCASLESANHGVCIGLSLPGETNLQTPMLWDEPNALQLNCAVNGATLWSDHLGLFGTRISDKCLFAEDMTKDKPRFVGKVQMKWNTENGAVSFDVMNGENKEHCVVASSKQDYFSKKSKYSAESSEEAMKKLVPTIAFSTVVNDDIVSLS